MNLNEKTPLKAKDYSISVMYREKEGHLTQSYDKTPYTNRKFENQRTTHKRHQNFDYTTIADRLRTVSWSNNSHPTGVVKPSLKGTNLPTHRNSSVIKQTRHDRNKVYNNTNKLINIDTFYMWFKIKWNTFLPYKNTPSLNFEANLDTENMCKWLMSVSTLLLHKRSDSNTPSATKVKNAPLIKLQIWELFLLI